MVGDGLRPVRLQAQSELRARHPDEDHGIDPDANADSNPNAEANPNSEANLDPHPSTDPGSDTPCHSSSDGPAVIGDRAKPIAIGFGPAFAIGRSVR
jgi:hypothetical protein